MFINALRLVCAKGLTALRAVQVVLSGVAPHLVQVLLTGQEYNQSYAVALLRVFLTVQDPDVHCYLAGLGLVPALFGILRSDSASEELRKAAGQALSELLPSEEVSLATARAGNVPLLAWAVAQGQDQDAQKGDA
eukprot:scaffold32535_cov21-Prasinocladus_malaysianus.AAC.2